MDEFIKMIMQAAGDSQKQTNGTGQRPTSFGSINDDFIVRSVKESAKVTKILFDEHVKIGFTEEQALKIVTSILSNKR